MVTRRLTQDGPLQKHRYMQLEAMAELTPPDSDAQPLLPPRAA